MEAVRSGGDLRNLGGSDKHIGGLTVPMVWYGFDWRRLKMKK